MRADSTILGQTHLQRTYGSLRDTRPRAFLLENVYGLVYKGKDEGLRYLLDGIKSINRETGQQLRHQLEEA